MPAARPIRRPLDGLSPYDPDAVRRWAVQRVTDEVVATGGVRPRLLVVFDDHVADLDLTDLRGGDPIALFEDLARRVDVEHRILCGHVAAPGADAAWVFAAQNDEDRSFWLANRAFRRLPGGVGSAEAEWGLTLGRDLKGVFGPPASLRRKGPPLKLLPATPLPLPTIGCVVSPLAPGSVAPTDPVAAIAAAVDLGAERDAVGRPLQSVTVFLFRDGTVERWGVSGELPVSLDDVVRALCAREPVPPVAVATVGLGVFADEGTPYRAVRTIAEAGGRRGERVAALKFDGSRVSHVKLFGRAIEVVPDGDGWIGVPPLSELELFPLPGPEVV